MIKLPKATKYEKYSFSVNKKEFIHWFKTVLLDDEIMSKEIKIETVSYMYYRSARYNELSASNVIRALMACVELSLEWRINSYEELNKKKEWEVSEDYPYTNRLYLKKIYNKFVDFLRYQTPVFSEIEREIYKLVNHRSFKQEEVFDFVCEHFGRQILRLFEEYINQEINKQEFNKYVKSLDQEKIEDFKNQFEDNRFGELLMENSTIVQELMTVIEHVFCNTCHGGTLGLMTSVSGLTINQGIEQDKGPDKDFGYYHIFNFFSYLQKQGLTHILESKEVLSLACDYCDLNDINSKQKFAKFLRNSYFGYQPWLNSVYKFVKNYREINLKYATYDKALCHCLILYKNEDDFKKKILEKKLWKKKSLWRNLNTVTENIMHIYYCELDERGTLTGYDLRNNLNAEGKLSISVDNVPSLLLWHDDIKSYQLINLKGINVEDYFEVIQAIVKPIDDYIIKTDTPLSHMHREVKREKFTEAINYAKQKVIDIRERTGAKILVKNQKSIVITNNNVGQFAYAEGSQTVTQILNTNHSENGNIQVLSKELLAYIQGTEFESEEQKEDLQEYIEMATQQCVENESPKKSILRTTKQKLENWSQSLEATSSIVNTIFNFINIIDKFVK